MSELLRMRTVDFKRLNEERVKAHIGDWEFTKGDLVYALPKDWDSKPVVCFNENFQDPTANFLWMTEMLMDLKIPYEYYCDGGTEADDYWEYYNPQINSEPQTANYAKDMSGFIFKTWNLRDLQHLSGDAFKEAVIQFFNNPFTQYPALDEIVD